MTKIGQTISSEEFSKKYGIGTTIDAKQFQELYPQKNKTTFSQFLARDIMYGATPEQSQGFLRGLIQKSIGSKGIAGVFQSPGRVWETAESYKLTQEMSESQEKMAQITKDQLKKVQTMPEGPDKDRVMGLIREDISNRKAMQEALQPTQERELTPQEAIGTGLSAASTVGAFALGAPSSWIQAAGYGSILGGTSSLGEAIRDEKDFVKTLRQTTLGAILGAVTFMGTYAAAKGLRGLTEKAPEMFYDKALKQSTKDLTKELRGKAPDLSQQLIKQGVYGTNNKIYNQSIRALNETEKTINKLVAQNSNKTIATQKIASSLDDIIQRKADIPGLSGMADTINKIKTDILAKGKELTVGQALQLKRDIYRELSQHTFNIDATLSTQSEGLRTVAHSLMEEISKVVPAIAKVTKNQQMWKRTATAMEMKISQSARHNIIGLSDSIIASAGVPGDVLTSTIGAVGRRFIESTPFQTGTAVLLDRVGTALNQLPKDATRSTINKIMTDIITQTMGQSRNQSDSWKRVLQESQGSSSDSGIRKIFTE